MEVPVPQYNKKRQVYDNYSFIHTIILFKH